MFFPRQLLKKNEGDKIIESIKRAELNTSGEIRVHFNRKIKGDIFEHAVKNFKRLKMDETERKNGVLLFIVPRRKEFCILGDEGINQVVPDNFWEEIKDDLSLHFKADKIAEGICKSIEKIGEKLKSHFPIQDDDINELPDTISYG